MQRMLYIGLIGVAIAIVAVLVVVAKPKRGAPAAARPAAAVAPVAVAPPPIAPAVALARRYLIVNPTTPFEKLAGAMGRAGFTPDAAPAGEPTTATWRTAAGVVHYTYEAELGLRKLEIVAPAAACASLVQAIVNEPGYVSTIDYQLSDYLDPSRSPQDLRFGIRGAVWRGHGEDHKYYWEKVGALRDHADPQVAAEAKAAYDALLAEAGGDPIPAGPRGLPLAWTRAGDDYVATHRGEKFVYKPDGTLILNGRTLPAKITEWPTRWTKA
jgi:hypothetical protein